MSYVSHADLGGRADDRPVRPEPAEPVFHADWEARALALTLAMGATGAWNIDMARSARETLPDYDRLSYYRIWLAALERLLVEQGLIRQDELEAGRALHPPATLSRVLHADQVATALAAGSPTQRSPQKAPRFAVGQAVRTLDRRPDHHTRLPAYAMDRTGRVQRIHGVHVFPDSHARGLGEQPQWLYSVVFDGRELFGEADGGERQVCIDAWEGYLVPVEDAA